MDSTQQNKQPKQHLEFSSSQEIGYDIITGKKRIEDFAATYLASHFVDNCVPVAFSAVEIDFSQVGAPKIRKFGNVANKNIFSANSMTKIVTAATLIRLTEEELYQSLLPNGVDTKLSELLLILKKHYPESKCIQSDLEKENHFSDITLRHLLQHSSGIGDFDLKEVEEILHARKNKKLNKESIDFPRGSGSAFGQHEYGDFSYELLGRIIVAIANEKNEGVHKDFGDIVDELVISRVQEKNPDLELNFVTSDKIEIVDGVLCVIGDESLKIEDEKYYFQNEFADFSGWRFLSSAGGACVDSESMAVIAFHILNKNPEISIYKDPKTVKMVFESEGLPVLGWEGCTYGFGFRKSSEGLYNHRGGGHVLAGIVYVDDEKRRVVCANNKFENLTLPLSYALLNERSFVASAQEESIEINENLYRKSCELLKSFSQEQLLEMRNCLEKNYKEFKDKYESLKASNEQPASHVAKPDAASANKGELNQGYHK